jgi:hypothetical protein
LDIGKVTILNFKVCKMENLDKSKKCRGPLVSLRRRLNGIRPLASCARQLLGHAPVARTQLWSSATYATLSLFPVAATPRLNPPSLIFLFALPSLCSSCRHRHERYRCAASTRAATLMRHVESSFSVPSPQAWASHRGAPSKTHAPPLPPRSASMWTGTSGHGTAPPTLPRASRR